MKPPSATLGVAASVRLVTSLSSVIVAVPVALALAVGFEPLAIVVPMLCLGGIAALLAVFHQSPPGGVGPASGARPRFCRRVSICRQRREHQVRGTASPDS